MSDPEKQPAAMPTGRQAQPDRPAMLRRLHVKGYRSLKDVVWEPGNLNILIGPNGGGKSNLLRALAMLRAMSCGKLRDFILADGGMASLMHFGLEKRSLTWNVECAVPEQGAEARLEVHTRLDQIGQSSDYVIGHERLKPTGCGASGGLYARLQDADEGDLSPAQEESAKESEWAREGLWFPRDDRHARTRKEVIQPVRIRMMDWAIHTEVAVGRSSEIRQPPQSRIEKHLDPDGQNLATVLHTLCTSNDAFREEINNGMRAAFGREFEELRFPPDLGQGRVQMWVKWRSLKKPISTDMLSHGTLYYLFLITALADPDPPALIAIDEPELHLHPSMLSLVAEYAMDAALRSQVVFATQSPEFLDCFTKKEVTTTVVTCENGETQLKNVGGERLARWLKDFRLGELFRSGQLEQWKEPGPPLPPGARERIAKLGQGKERGE
jgi:predicted ATPase